MAEGVTADHRLSHVSTASSTNSKRAKAHIGPWQLGRTLGRGSSGRVRLAKHMETGKLAAVKIVPKSQILDPTTGLPSKSSESFGIEREVIIMKLIEHPNIMTLYDVWENKGELYLVLEYIEGGELFDYLISRGRLSEREAIHYFRQICYGVEYCHKFNICHRDLKPENLLLDKHRNIKLADFGMAALESNGRLLETSCGSPHYASPEIVTGKTYHGAPSDIWSCGIILFALLTGHLPFDDDNIRQLLLKVQAGKFSMPSSLSWEARDLIARMLVVNPARRITMREIFAHPLMTKYPLRRVPIENIDKKTPKVDVTQPITRIDPEILRNLQTLWHHDSREYLISQLRQTEPNTEKTFYSLLLRFRQRHGLAAREAIPRNRSVASIRSLRSSKSVRSISSMNSKAGSIKSLKSVRSNRSGRSLVSRRMARYSPAKHHQQQHKHNNTSTVSRDEKSTNQTVMGYSKPSTTASAVPANNGNTDMFAQILDEAFNHQQKNDQRIKAPANNNTVPVSLDPQQPSTPTSSSNDKSGLRDPTNFQQNGVTTNITTSITSDPHSVQSGANDSHDYFSKSTESVYQNNPASTVSTVQPEENFSFETERMPFRALNLNFSSEPLDFGVIRNEADPAGSQTQTRSTQNNYLLPMIFEEDRFADAIEEEVEMKVYNRPKQTTKPTNMNVQHNNQPSNVLNVPDGRNALLSSSAQNSHQSNIMLAKINTGSTMGSSRKQPGDNSQLRIHNLVSGESFLSYQPSAAAQAITAPVRPAPKAPNGPRVMSQQRKTVPIYVENDTERPQEDTQRPVRTPLAPLNTIGSQRNVTKQHHQQPDKDLQQITVSKRGFRNQRDAKSDASKGNASTVPKEKKSWIRRLTPRIVSRKMSKSDATTTATTEKNTTGSNASKRFSSTIYAANKENDLSGQGKTVGENHSGGYNSRFATQQRYSSFEEPRQNWFMKILTVSTHSSSRTLLSTCQPIELRAIILEVLSEWMPHGLAAYTDGSRGEPISVAILRNNSLKLKPARVSIDIKPSEVLSSSARLVHESGARSSFFTFAGELERRLSENNVLGD